MEFNGDRLHNLHLFANPMEKEVYSGEAKGVMFFGPGVHRPKDLPNNQIRVPSNTTVYLAPGAVLKAKLLVDNAENVRIIGRGILDHPIRGIEITDSENVLVDGITVVNPEHYTVFGGGSSEIVIRNLKSFSCRSWSDGIDMMCCRSVRLTMSSCAIRTTASLCTITAGTGGEVRPTSLCRTPFFGQMWHIPSM